MNHFKKRLTVELSVSLLIVTALLIGIIFFKGNISDYSQKIRDARALLASRTGSVGQLADLRLQYNNKANNYMNVLQNIIPSYDQLINLNRDLQLLASQNNVDYGFSFAGENPKTSQTLGSIAFNLTASSDNFNYLLNYVKALQNFRYLSSIDNISIKSNKDEISFFIKGRIFYR
ncbi:MAG: hypothetical protein ABSE68_00595 [Minisyncoccia bacterium]